MILLVPNPNVVGTASLTLANGAKQAGLVGCSGIYL